jgi:hypothetical protein
MRAANFCVECGEPLSRKGWRARLGGQLCGDCRQKLGSLTGFRPIVVVIVVAVAAFTIGKHLQPAPPPLIIQRAANSPLSDAPVNFNSQAAKETRVANPDANSTNAPVDDAVYICGARTKKGTPCHRRVHAAGERCFQHKGMTAMLPLEKLMIQNPER